MDEQTYPGINYLLFAHGCDIIDAENRPLIKNIAKENVYITTTSCGIESVSNEWGATVFNLQNSVQTTLFTEVEKKAASGDDAPYHVNDGKKKPDYVDNLVTPMVDINISFGDYVFMLYRSGLIPVDYIRTHKDIIYEAGENYYNAIMFSYTPDTNTIYRTDNANVPIVEVDGKPLEKIVNLAFAGSVYPQVEDVLQIFHKYAIDTEPNIKLKRQNFAAFKEEVKKVFKIPISTLFEKFPGTYFNTSCRTVCGSTEEDDSLNQTEYVKLRREKSFKKGGMKKTRKTRKTRKMKRTRKSKKY
jgi:hypothetical protein